MVLAIFCSIVGLFFLILCLLDLPLDKIIASFFKSSQYKLSVDYLEENQQNQM